MLVGAQDIRIDPRTNKAESNGQALATALGETLSIDLHAQFDIDATKVKGHGKISGGTGLSAGIRTSWNYDGQSIGFRNDDVTINGLCHGA